MIIEEKSQKSAPFVLYLLYNALVWSAETWEMAILNKINVPIMGH